MHLVNAGKPLGHKQARWGEVRAALCSQSGGWLKVQARSPLPEWRQGWGSDAEWAGSGDRGEEGPQWTQSGEAQGRGLQRRDCTRRFADFRRSAELDGEGLDGPREGGTEL